MAAVFSRSFAGLARGEAVAIYHRARTYTVQRSDRVVGSHVAFLEVLEGNKVTGYFTDFDRLRSYRH